MGCCGSSDEGGMPAQQKMPLTPKEKILSEEQQIELSESTGNELMLKYTDIVDEIIGKGKPYTDKSFPPNAESIQRHDDGPKQQRFNGIQWMRASEIFNEPAIFQDGIEPNDIEQGALGDCYYLSALSSMAEDPERIKARFVTQEVNQAGIYLVNFFVNGLLTPVIIDDYLPTKNGKPCFARSRDEELWVCLLEKAWAKLYGAYARMEGGDPSFAAIHLNGSPATTIWHDEFENEDDIEGLWTKILAADEKGYEMMCGTKGQGEEKMGKGMISGHAYSLIAAKEVETDDGPVRLLQLRNPWGQGEWTGDWSDESDKWTDELKATMDFTDENDGIFHMCFDDYLKNYLTTSICVTVDANEYHFSRCLYDYGANNVNTKKFKFTLTENVPSTDSFTISVAQQGQRLRYERAKQNKFSPSAIKIKLFKEGADNWIEGAYQRAFNNWLEVDKEDLEEGSYIIEVSIPQWNAAAQANPDYKRICVTILCKQEFELEACDDYDQD